MVFPLGPAKGVLAWRVLLWQALAAYYVVVDDASGLVLFRKNITADQSQTATFDVYASDSPAPLSPSNATPGSGIQGAATSRTRFSLVSELPDFDNLGWIPDGSGVTTGNNVDAGLDIDGVNGIDPDGRAAGLCAGPSPGCRNFTFAYNPPPGGSDPPTGTDARMGGVTDLFFWSNRYRERLRSDEPAGPRHGRGLVRLLRPLTALGAGRRSERRLRRRRVRDLSAESRLHRQLFLWHSTVSLHHERTLQSDDLQGRRSD